MQYVIHKYYWDDAYFSISMNSRALRRLDSLFLNYVHSLPESFCSQNLINGKMLAELA